MGEVSLEEGYRALREAAGGLVVDRDVVRVCGPEAKPYLQGQTSQDIAALGVGDCAWALVLQPQGKLDAFVRVLRAGAEEFLLVTDGGVGQSLVARLNRFKLATKAEVNLLGWGAVSVLGPAATATGWPPSVEGCRAVPFEWGGLLGYDLVGPNAALPGGVAEVGRDAYEAVRIEAGFPRHGAELDERTIPEEAGLVQACVSFTKGCYTGQELVARIDSRGANVARRLRGLLLSGPAGLSAVLFQDGVDKPAGTLTSVGFSPRLGWVALGYAGRSVAPGAVLAVGVPGGKLRASVADLPMSQDGGRDRRS